jgi:putative chitinase|tara:strand:- start:1407 stop:2246 length:840 start_codon:yes stop_codon:yes gene_type:complete
MDFDFTEDQVATILHKDDVSDWYNAMVEMFPKYEITTPNRVAGFIAQTAHESASYKTITENLNYSAKALNAIFGKYFHRAGVDAQKYHRQPEKIANRIYAGRMDNGDTASGDGWTFRGGGILQLTGRYNYTEFGKTVGMSAEEATDYVRTPKGAIESACWFWKTNNINKYCDADDIVRMTKRINGGTIGLADRKKHYAHALEVLGGHVDFDDDNDDVELKLVRRGSKGDTVAKLQEALGLDADGDFGRGTEAALKAWQLENDCTPDGIAGPQTLSKIFA